MTRTGKPLVALCLILAAVIFFVDISLPLGVAGGVPYVAVVLLSLWSPHRSFTISVAVLCSILTVAGYFLSPAGGEHWQVLSNRFLAEMVIWTSTILGLGRKSVEGMLDAERNTLEEKVEARTSALEAEAAERKRTQTALAKSDEHYRAVFRDSPVPLWDEDITELLLAMERLKAGGVTDLRAYMEENPEFVYRAAQMVKVLDVNDATLRLYNAASKEELLGSLDKTFEPESYAVIKEQLIAIAEGRGHFEAETVVRTLRGERLNILISATYPKGSSSNGQIMVSTMDITERKRVEGALEDQLQFFQTLIDNIPSPIFYKDTEGRYLGCNVAFEKSVGLSHADIKGKTVYDLAPQKLADRYFEMDKRLFDDPGIQIYETKVRYTDGKEHDILFNKATFNRADGSMAGLVGVMTDVTGHRRAEAELGLSKRMLETVLDTIPVRVFWKDLNLKYMGCNTAFAKDAELGSPDEIAGKDDFELVWAKKADMYRADDAEVIKTGKAKLNYEEPLGGTGPEGDLPWLQTSKVPLKDANGNIIGVLGTYEDITERKSAEEQIRKLSRAVEQSFECVVITDTEGTIEYVNPYFTELTGYTFDEVVGQNPRLLKSGEHGGRFYKELWDTIRSGGVWRGQFHNRKKSGELYWEYASISPIRDENGQLTHFIAVKEDITERKRAEEELREKSEKLDLVNRDLHDLTMEMTRVEETEKKRFAELLHDDIGQNLVAVKMALSSTLKRASGLKPEAREQLGDANALLESTIGSIRALSSDLYPVVPYIEGLIDKKGLIEAVRWHEKNILNPAGIETRVEIAPAVEELNEDCKRQIYMVLQESFQNIMKHSSATRVCVYCAVASNTLSISVKDNGVGFTNGAARLKTVGGIGLRLMRERVKSMGGELIIESEKGRGTTVRAEFKHCCNALNMRHVDKEEDEDGGR